jgi:asparagine synthase (glutamine-hydrolysing)
MCGICGNVGWGGDETRLRSAVERMRHRGPDQSGEWIGDGVLLGHCRLSVIDLSEAGRQPMASLAGDVVVFNGEIYNYRALREELGGPSAFHSRTDSEVLLHGYRRWGLDGLVRRLRGMFAFGLWDGQTRDLFLVRDPFGEKPLYYAEASSRLAFASTLPALTELLGATPELDEDGVARYLVHRAVPSPQSMFRGIRKLPPGSILRYRAGSNATISRYWTPLDSEVAALPEPDALERVAGSLRGAVRDRVYADVPVGVFLSGGIDSSLVAAVASEATGSLQSFTVSFPDSPLDESAFATQAAQALGVHATIVPFDEKAAARALPEIVFHSGEPIADAAILPLYQLVKASRPHITVALTGDGGDELFGGYNTALGLRLAQRLAQVPHLARLLSAATSALPAKPSAVRWARWILAVAKQPAGWYVYDPAGEHSPRRMPVESWGPRLRELMSTQAHDDTYLATWAGMPQREWVQRAWRVDLATLLPDLFLAKTDTMTMSHGLEARAPFLDPDLCRFAMSLPTRLKLRGTQTKWLLRELARRWMPQVITSRPKHGFSVDRGRILRGHLAGFLRGMKDASALSRLGFLDQSALGSLIRGFLAGRVASDQTLWTLLVLEVWLRLFVTRELTPHDEIALS